MQWHKSFRHMYTSPPPQDNLLLEMAKTIEQLFVGCHVRGVQPKIFHSITRTVPKPYQTVPNRNTQTILATCPCFVICQFYSHQCAGRT